ncbi:hypothetical protein [Microbacterium schleiferi]|nr:hypothetical protein [Microbacterium schleiferi]
MDRTETRSDSPRAPLLPSAAQFAEQSQAARASDRRRENLGILK